MSLPPLQFNPRTLDGRPGPSWLGIFPWAEFPSKSLHGSQESAHSYNTGNQATFAIIVNFYDYARGQLDPAIGRVVTVQDKILGTNNYNLSTGNLDRVPPVRHPYLHHLRATKIVSAKPYKWTGKISDISDAGFETSFSEYKYCLMHILFTMPRHKILSDADLDVQYPPVGGQRQEWRRNVRVEPVPSSAVLSRDGGDFSYAEGPPASVGRPVRGQLAQYLSRPSILLTWFSVPRSGLMSDGGDGLPFNLLAGQSCVNLTPFMSAPAGTLLVKSIRFVEQEAPSLTAVNFAALGQPPIVYDATIELEYYNPVPFGTVRGHNLFPNPAENSVPPKWCLVTQSTTGDPNAARLLPSYEFRSLFRLQP